MSTKLFEFPEVDCNDCKHYWDDSCSGAFVNGSERVCTAFKATRHTDIPLQINRLKSAFKWLTGAFVILTIILLGGLVLCLR
jgi:hypothetical protein